jgi:glucose-6-phosphate 1-dehydrogenase
VFVRLHRPPQTVFSGRNTEADRAPGNYIRFLLSPVVQIALGARVLSHRVEGAPRGKNIELQAVRAEPNVEPYHRLLTEAMQGGALLFAREDSVEAAWRIVDAAVADTSPVIEYEPGTWGPIEADRWVADHGGWHRTRGGRE